MQLHLDSYTGTALKEAGLDQVESDTHFLDVMRTHAKIISDTYGRVTSDSLRTVAANMGLEPRSSHSWGAIFRGKHWKVIGMEPSRLPSNHGRMIRVYRWEE
jgi:hypothetical protein